MNVTTAKPEPSEGTFTCKGCGKTSTNPFYWKTEWWDSTKGLQSKLQFNKTCPHCGTNNDAGQ